MDRMYQLERGCANIGEDAPSRVWYPHAWCAISMKVFVTWFLYMPSYPMMIRMLWIPLCFSRLSKDAMKIKMLKENTFMHHHDGRGVTGVHDVPLVHHDAPLWLMMFHHGVLFMLMGCTTWMNVPEDATWQIIIGWHLHGIVNQWAWPIRVLGLIPQV